MEYPRPKGTADLEERTGHNAEDFLDIDDARDGEEEQEEEEGRWVLKSCSPLIPGNDAAEYQVEYNYGDYGVQEEEE